MSPSPAFTAPVALRSHFLSPSTILQTCPNTLSVAVPRRSIYPTMAFSSIDGILTPPPVSLPNDPDTVINAVYKQVMGNAHIMESEREEFYPAETQFRLTGSVREFVREIALSKTYKARFFDSVSQFRFIELAFKHLLGRAASSASEYASVMNEYHSAGYEACIDWFLDSPEYFENFGEGIVPYGIYKGCYTCNEVFNRSVAMRLTPSSSDKGRSAMLQYCVLSADSPNWLSISKGLPAGTEKGTGLSVGSRNTSTQRNKNAPVRVGTKIPGGVVFYD